MGVPGVRGSSSESPVGLCHSPSRLGGRGGAHSSVSAPLLKTKKKNLKQGKETRKETSWKPAVNPGCSPPPGSPHTHAHTRTCMVLFFPLPPANPSRFCSTISVSTSSAKLKKKIKRIKKGENIKKKKKLARPWSRGLFGEMEIYFALVSLQPFDFCMVFTV